MKRQDVLDVPVKGVLVDNVDPKKLSRVKCSIEDIFPTGTDKELLPWISKWNPSGRGGAVDSGEFNVPDIGTELTIEHPFQKDPYFAFYTGYWQSATTHQGFFNEDYPFTWGWQDPSHNYFKVNRAKRTMEMHHETGSTIRFEADSVIELMSRKGIRFRSEDGQTEMFFDMLTGRMDLSPKDGLNFAGPIVTMAPKAYVMTTGSESKEITGASSTNVVGGYKVNVGGGYSISVVSAAAQSFASKWSCIIADEAEQTYGMGYSASVILGDYATEILLGNWELDIKAGDITMTTLLGNVEITTVAGDMKFKTTAGNVEIGNIIAFAKFGLTGDVNISAVLNAKVEAKLNAEIKALVKAKVEASAIAEIKGALTMIGNGTAPMVSILTDPLEDLITGKPKFGIPTVLGG